MCNFSCYQKCTLSFMHAFFSFFLYSPLLLSRKYKLYFSLSSFRMFRLFKCIFSFLLCTSISLGGLLSSFSFDLTHELLECSSVSELRYISPWKKIIRHNIFNISSLQIDILRKVIIYSDSPWSSLQP